MGAIGLAYRSELRRRWRSWLSIALLVGCGRWASCWRAGAAGRRTATAFPDFVTQHGFDAVVYGRTPLGHLGSPCPASMPGTREFVGPDNGQPRCDLHTPDRPANDTSVVVLSGRRLRTDVLVSGRRPDPSDPHQVDRVVHHGAGLRGPPRLGDCGCRSTRRPRPPPPTTTAGAAAAPGAHGVVQGRRLRRAAELEFPTGGVAELLPVRFAGVHPGLCGPARHGLRATSSGSGAVRPAPPLSRGDGTDLQCQGLEFVDDRSMDQISARWSPRSTRRRSGGGFLAAPGRAGRSRRDRPGPGPPERSGGRGLSDAERRRDATEPAVRAGHGSQPRRSRWSVPWARWDRDALVTHSASGRGAHRDRGRLALRPARAAARRAWRPGRRRAARPGAGGVDRPPATRSQRGADARSSVFAERLAAFGARPQMLVGVRSAFERRRGSSSVPVGSAIVGTVLAVAGLCRHGGVRGKPRPPSRDPGALRRPVRAEPQQRRKRHDPLVRPCALPQGQSRRDRRDAGLLAAGGLHRPPSRRCGGHPPVEGGAAALDGERTRPRRPGPARAGGQDHARARSPRRLPGGGHHPRALRRPAARPPTPSSARSRFRCSARASASARERPSP